jgi:NAD(P)-dependent dehydrogenase (short-subunit alcohol dehydrogenase family)
VNLDLTGKVALVTGGSRGLGRAMVLGFAEHGADVVIASRKLDACAALADEVTETFDVRALPVACNVGSWEQCDALIDAAYAEFGRVDVLVNNAGMSPVYPSLSEVTEALYDKVFATNLKGAFRLTAVVGERMAASNGGSVINISSVGSLRPDPTLLPYAAAKAGLNAFTEGFARAYAPNVRVNTIVCGMFRTDIIQAWTPGMLDAFTPQVLLGRVGEPGEIVGAALFLASEASSYATGSHLRLDGGLR